MAQQQLVVHVPQAIPRYAGTLTIVVHLVFDQTVLYDDYRVRRPIKEASTSQDQLNFSQNEVF